MFATPDPPACSGFVDSETSRFHSENSTQTREPGSSLPRSVSSEDDQIPRRRSSVFFEAGLQGEDALVDAQVRRNNRPRIVRFRSNVEVVEPVLVDWSTEESVSVDKMPAFFPTLPRMLFFAIVIAIVLPSLGNSPLLKAGVGPIGAKAGPVAVPLERQRNTLPQKRQDAETVVCKRWSQQSALVNGTLYLYGGRTTTSADQSSDTWSMCDD
jgi:hypothetical protein